MCSSASKYAVETDEKIAALIWPESYEFSDIVIIYLFSLIFNLKYSFCVNVISPVVYEPKNSSIIRIYYFDVKV